MDFVSKAYAQLVELIGSMSAGTRLATGLLLAVVAVSFALLLRIPLSGDDEFLLGGRPFSSSELTAIEAAFATAGLGQSQIVGSQVRIPRGKKDVYLAALADANALPADFYKHLDEATNADSPFASTKSLEMRRWNAKQKELALIISRMKNIESATVLFDEEVKQGLVRQKQRTATVAVQTRGGRLEADQVKAIRNVVAAAYAGLERHQITITDIASGLSFGGAVGPDGVPEDESLYATHKERYERDWQRKITEQLTYISGIVVGINVELNPEIERASQTHKLDPKPVTVRSSESQKDSTTQAPQVAGRPGAQSNGVGNQPVALQQAAAAGPESQTTESRSETQNAAGHESTLIRSAGLVPKRVTASIEVPASYFVQVWKQLNPPAAGQPAKTPDPADIAKLEVETHNKIKETVRNLLPDVPTGTTPWPHIVVSTYTDLPTAAPTPPSAAAQAGTWLADNWKTLALIGIGLMSLAMIRSMVRSPAGAPSPASSAAGDVARPKLAAHEPADMADEPEPVRVLQHRFKAKGADLKTELHEIVKDNPDAAATVLRAWIGDAA